MDCGIMSQSTMTDVVSSVGGAWRLERNGGVCDVRDPVGGQSRHGNEYLIEYRESWRIEHV